MELSRRSFLGAAAMAAVAMPAASVAFADEAPAADVLFPQIAVDEDVVAATGWSGTPAQIEQLGGSNMPLSALNMYRQKYVDAAGEVVQEDGKVIPAVYAKVRALINTYGYGWGNVPMQGAFDDLMQLMTEAEAEAFLSMPWGEKFRPIDWAAKSGRTLEECTELCERFVKYGYLFRIETAGGNRYHQMAYVQGLAEIRQIQHAAVDPNFNVGLLGSDMMVDQEHTGTLMLRAIPCDTNLVADAGVFPYDDIREIIEAAEYFAVAPCSCRYSVLKNSMDIEDIPTLDQFAAKEMTDWVSPIANRRVETCFHMGDEARFHVSVGNAREITKDEAIALMERAVEEGFILQKLFNKDAQTVCSCEVGSCKYLKGFAAVGLGAAESRPFAQNRSNYDVLVDADTCAKCGICADRCPMKVIVMDPETGLPTLGNEQYGPLCFGCGQCAYVCPMGARSLVARPAEEILDLPQDILDDHNMKAAYRFEHGMMGL